jgi:putative peptide zinc metalloprotease protein
MASTSDDYRSSTSRRLLVRRRPDVIVQQLQAAQQPFWVLKDPVSLRYARLNEAEFFIWERLDGAVSLEDIRRDFGQRFAPQQLAYPQLNAFLGDLHRKNLVLADAADQGTELQRRDRQTRRREWLQMLGSVLAVRFRGIDPEPLLRWLEPLARPLLSRWALAASAVLILVAVAIVGTEFAVLQARLPSFRAFFSAANVVALAVVLAAIKLVHELGHALVCKRLGGQCHELGFMLLVFVPCLYVDVSDAWMLPNKWHRAAVSAAGVWIEVVLAAVCTLLWWFSEPGWLNALCLNAMFVCSISTLVFNGNPLLRYDGYYIAADLLEVPNLWQESRAYLASVLRRWCLGWERDDDAVWLGSRRALLATYGIASQVYRATVLVGIVLFLFAVLRPYRLQLLAQLVLGLVLVGAVVAPATAAWRAVRSPISRREVSRGRLGWSGVILATLFVGLCWLPVPTRVSAPLVLEPQGAQRVYVSVAGQLDKVWVEPGTAVATGQALAQLVNLDLAHDVARLEGELRQQHTVLAGLEARRSLDPAAGMQLPVARKALEDIRQRLEKTRGEQQKLALVAPTDGAVIPPPRLAPDARLAGRLPTWTGTPLDERNRGCVLETGVLFCLIGDPQRLEAVLYVDQSDLELVQRDQRVRLRVETLPGWLLTGMVTEISQRDAKVAPRELTPQDLPLEVGPDGIARPIEAAYQVRVALDDHDQLLPVGSRGRGKVVVSAQPLGRRLYRYLSQTFTFRL